MTLFHHEALLYAGEEEFLAGTVPFVREGMAGGEPVLAVLGPRQTAWLSAALGEEEAGRVAFADMAAVGGNPARIIPAWQDFVSAHPDRPVRGIGEPIWPGRGASELVECQRHEALLNVAFADRSGFRLLCPYDAGLGADVLAEAHSTHPHVGGRPSAGYRDADPAFAAPLPEPCVPVSTLRFDSDTLPALRALVAELATAAGLSERRVEDFVLAASELAGNSVRHAGGAGIARLWLEDGALICEVADDGRILDPLVGRRRPAPGQLGGYGLWLANQLCDLVQVRTFRGGGAVRAHMRLRAH